jgi:cation diffusion facilitator CzcD-associated flavoprotein CzcO
MADEFFDVVIVGAGLSGIGAGYHLQTEAPDRSYVILEGREAMGGTWDLFRYPGVRSDSDMFTLGYGFRPWASDRSITDGPSIRDYIRQAAKDGGIDRHVRYRHRLVEADWDSARAQWTLTVEVAGEPAPRRVACRFLVMCAGYFDHDRGHDPQWPGLDQFAGPVVHAQHWPESLDTAGKRVVVIGSGATAVTLVPELAKTAAQVTMLQRSPTYVVARPSVDGMARTLGRGAPGPLVHRLIRWKYVFLQWLIYRHARRHPQAVKRFLVGQARKQLPPGYDVDRHFTPRYDPWDQRLCLVPDGDLFSALRGGRAQVVTDEIERVVPQGLQLKSGALLEADVLVKATGLQLRMGGGARLVVDGRPVSLADTVAYKGVMFSGVPNLVSVFGYTNASWTLKCELIAKYVCRLLDHMRRHGEEQVTPVFDDPQAELGPVLELTSGYVQRSAAQLPRQGPKAPWRMNQNYFKDLVALGWQPVDDGALRFSRRASPQQPRQEAAA